MLVQVRQALVASQYGSYKTGFTLHATRKHWLPLLPNANGYLGLRRYATQGHSRPLILGIRREDKNRWERRVALIPSDIQALVQETEAKVLVQPSRQRIYPDQAFREVGATVQEDLSEADVIFGIKEIPPQLLLPEKTYIFFSHTHKGQPYNQPTLQTVLDKRVRLIDYELITDDQGHRTVLFGQHAGWAGAVDSLHGLGQRLLAKGFHTPLLYTGMAHTYRDMSAIRTALQAMGEAIQRDGLPRELGPLTFVVAGSGNVSKGVWDILSMLPHRVVSASELPRLTQQPDFDNHIIYLVQLRPEDYLVHKHGGEVTRQAYHQYPQDFLSLFDVKIAPYTSVLVNATFWDGRQPRLLTKAHLRTLQANASLQYRMLSIAEIGCEIGGPLEFMSHFSSIDHPFYYVDAVQEKEHRDDAGPGVQILGVENLPAELPLDSSHHFSQALMPLIPDIIQGRFDTPTLHRATIAAEGALLPPHQHLAEGLKQLSQQTGAGIRVTSLEPKRVLLVGSGMVARPLVEYLTRQPDFQVTVASNHLLEAEHLVKNKPNARSTLLDVEDDAKVSQLIQNADVAVSLVPAPLHPRLARHCITHGKHMVTASYISPEMKSLDKAAQEAQVVIMNEIGLDPGIDHLTAMKVIHEAQNRGGQVTSFISWCGGLPAPEASSNPLGYKFSWSPRGVLTAGANPALFKMNHRTFTVPGERLMASAFPDVPLYPGFSLEGLPNRDSLKYIDTYGLGSADAMETMFRGTLRFKGYAEVMGGLAQLGLLSLEPLPKEQFTNWSAFLDYILTDHRGESLGLGAREKIIGERLGYPVTHPLVQRVMAALQWLGMMSGSNDTANTLTVPTALDGLSAILQHQMQYSAGERDMTILYHEFVVRYPQVGQRVQQEVCTSSMVAYGTPGGDTSMAKTVGLPCAMATELLLRDRLSHLTGVRAPIYPEVYNPILESLSNEGIVVKETLQRGGTSMSKQLLWRGGSLQ
ncbi:hypothetical protein IWQ62_004027 [Dispira parvispora]|uniref:Saccharopine dehydrogenase (NAD(+), L-glutamate-forming) n=1 Tax=Dispira parvispora TaxID=1520584 RepID=A0A9W8ALQ7_9FUNG|nr:hypothetical protein IWQ62_004027 [Dispira parvispora]